MDRRQEVTPIGRDPRGEGGARGEPRREAILPEPPTVAGAPLVRDPPWEPRGRDRGGRSQGVARRLPDQRQAVAHLDRGQDVRRIGPLPPARPDEALLAQRGEQGLEEPGLHPVLDQARAELAQDRGIEAGVLQGQAERVLPVDPGAHRVGRLAIRQSSGELEERDQGQPRRAGAGWPSCGESVANSGFW